MTTNQEPNRICKYCGKAFYAKPHRIKDGLATFCSTKCRGADRSTYRKTPENNTACKNCGLSFHAYPSEAKHGQGIYCSSKCRYEYIKSHRIPPKPNRTCITCGKHFYMRPSRKVDDRKGIFCSPVCRTTASIGKTLPMSARLRISEAQRGEKGNNWRGGISFEPYCPKFNRNLKMRVRVFFGYECIICGKNEQQNEKCLSVHHVEYDKAACCDGKPVRFAALCHSCHSKTNHNRTRWEAMLHRCIDEIWGGRSYYTKEEYAEICKQPPDEDVRQ